MNPRNPIKQPDAQTEGSSANIVEQNIAKLRDLFPDAFTEGSKGEGPRYKIDFDVLKQILGEYTEIESERYSFTWNGKSRARRIAQTPSTGTLRPRPKESVTWDKSRNLFIEGDNLEVLKLLQKSYHRQITVIYIDPPYNTGKDFIYPDSYKDNLDTYLRYTKQIDDAGLKVSANTETSGRFHTNWLSMMLPRLKLARNLLADRGILLVSIDDHERDNLRHLCDEVFGEENFVAAMVWEKGRKNDAKLVSVGHEYVLVYARSLGALREAGTMWREEKPGAREIWAKYLELRKAHGNDDTLIETDIAAWYSALPKSHPAKKWSRYKRIDANGPWRDHDISWPGGGGPRYDVIHPVTGKPCKVPEDGWRFSKPEEMQRQIALGLVAFRDDHTEPPFRKAHIRPVAEGIEVDADVPTENLSEDQEEEFAVQVRGSYFYKQSQVAVKHLKSLLGAKAFDNPKDHLELARLLNYVTSGDPSAIVMDFFAGSGSTAHAVMELNQSDGGNRRFLLVQLPEALDPENKDQKVAAKYCDQIGRPRNIAELTKERLSRAGAAIREENPLFAGDVGFRVFKLDSSNIKPWDVDFDTLEQAVYDAVENVKPDRSEQDVLYELLLKFGLDLCVPIEERKIAGKTVFSVGAGALMVCLDKKITLDVVEGIAKLKEELKPEVMRVVFRDSGFKDDVVKTNAVQILKQVGLSDEHVRSI